MEEMKKMPWKRDPVTENYNIIRVPMNIPYSAKLSRRTIFTDCVI